MAYAIELVREKCTEPGCPSWATVIVKTNRNETVRVCCPKHGKALVDELAALEERGR